MLLVLGTRQKVGDEGVGGGPKETWQSFFEIRYPLLKYSSFDCVSLVICSIVLRWKV